MSRYRLLFETLSCVYNFPNQTRLPPLGSSLRPWASLHLPNTEIHRNRGRCIRSRSWKILDLDQHRIKSSMGSARLSQFGEIDKPKYTHNGLQTENEKLVFSNCNLVDCVPFRKLVSLGFGHMGTWVKPLLRDHSYR